MRFKEIHADLIKRALQKDDMRLHNEIFTLTDFDLESILGINGENYLEYYQGFFDWLLTGSMLPGEFIILSEKAQKYRLEFKGRNVAYGPRIISQIDYVISRLRERPTSKRASLMILEKEDSIVNEADFTIEYPCTIGYSFYIENEKLCMTTMMRSNNVCSVIGLDVFLSISLMRLIAKELGREMGSYTHFMVDAHIIPSELDRAKYYLDLYEEERCI